MVSSNGSATCFCPGGARENSPAIYRWDRNHQGSSSPGGTIETSRVALFQSSLRDCRSHSPSPPSDKSLGYSQSSLRDGPSRTSRCFTVPARAAPSVQALAGQTRYWAAVTARECAIPAAVAVRERAILAAVPPASPQCRQAHKRRTSGRSRKADGSDRKDSARSRMAASRGLADCPRVRKASPRPDTDTPTRHKAGSPCPRPRSARCSIDHYQLE